MLGLGLACTRSPAAPEPLSPQPELRAGVGLLRAPAPPLSMPAREAQPGELGTAHPAWVVEAADDGSWVALCQARSDDDADGEIAVRVGPRGELSGDPLSLYLAEGAGAGQRIDRFVAAAPGGRHLAFLREGRLWLRDVRAGQQLDLSGEGAVTRTDEGSFSPHRAARFSPDGRSLLYVRGSGARERVVLRDLAAPLVGGGSGETVFDPGEGLLFRAEFDATGNWVVMQVVNGDTNGNGRWEWPIPPERRAPAPCAGPLPRYRAWRLPGDEPVARVARVTGGAVREVRGFVTGFGDGFVRRPPDRALFFDRPGEVSQLISASRCNARVLHSDPRRELLVVGCGGGDETLRRVALVGVDTQIDLELEVESFEVDRVAPVADRLVPLYPGIEALVVDLETRETHVLERRDRVIATRGTTLLVERRGRLLMGDVREQLLPIGRWAPLSPIVRKPPVVFLRPWLVDLEQALVIGRLDRDALALTRDGALLLPRRDGDSRRLPEGPLSWLRAQPLD